MEGCATPDNHSLMLHQMRTRTAQGSATAANTSYDLADHREILAAYDKFLDRWGFRAAFPATEKLWLSLGKKCYETWQNYMENARISDELDFAAISGWESTAIENHWGLSTISGISSPIPGRLRRRCCRCGLWRSRGRCASEKDESAIFDLYLCNDTSKPATGTLSFTVVTPRARS